MATDSKTELMETAAQQVLARDIVSRVSAIASRRVETMLLRETLFLLADNTDAENWASIIRQVKIKAHSGSVVLFAPLSQLSWPDQVRFRDRVADAGGVLKDFREGTLEAAARALTAEWPSEIAEHRDSDPISSTAAGWDLYKSSYLTREEVEKVEEEQRQPASPSTVS